MPAAINGKEFFELLREDLPPLSASSGGTQFRASAITEIGEYLRNGAANASALLQALAAKLFNYQGRGAIRLGAVVEIIHTATLVHDDIIDEAQTRRGRPAANTQWATPNAFCRRLAHMQAFKVVSRSAPHSRHSDRIDQQMVEGELLQMENRRLSRSMTISI
jgi:octaprenyl-diphosphate synthase